MNDHTRVDNRLIPSDLRSEATAGRVSTTVREDVGSLCVVCFAILRIYYSVSQLFVFTLKFYLARHRTLDYMFVPLRS